MSRFVILGTSGDASLVLVDLQERSVETIPAASVDETIAKLRSEGTSVVRGVDLAIAVDDRSAAVGRFFFDGGAVR